MVIIFMVFLFQRPAILGHKVEHKIADLVEQNHKLMKFGIFFEVLGARVRLMEFMQRNNDAGNAYVHSFKLPYFFPTA